jgi:signal transduction histidine kinase
VFVNIIDNAIFWLKDLQQDKVIIIDANENGFIISNNGPEISVRDMDAIFDVGFSRTPMGRGLGLHVSKQVLLKVGWDISVIDPQPNMNVSFSLKNNKLLNNSPGVDN